MALSWRKPRATQAEEDDRFLLRLEDDTEEAPWMVMGTPQFWSASSFAHCLHSYALAHDLPWFVASMLPIRYRRKGSRRKGQLSPDCFVSFVPDHARSSYDLEVEGSFPPFVLEVVSPESVQRDEQQKRRAYGLLGAREYALFTPGEAGASTLAGYRRDAAGLLAPWPAAPDGSLWSEVLGLRLVVEGALLLAETAAGEHLLSPEQEAVARQEAEREYKAEARARQEEAATRRKVEVENERLRRKLDRLRHERA